MDAKSTLFDRPDVAATPVPTSPRPEPAERIDPRAVRAWRVSGAISAGLILAFAIGLAVFVRWLDGPWWLIGTPVLLALVNAMVVVVVIPTVRWRQWRYAVTERDIDLKRGIIFITRTLVPMTRVQHVDTTQGPIMRHYGLASVIVATAAGAQEIPALSLDVAEQLRDRIAGLAGVAEDV
jgi:membrane protein YdbS with pleckstrin-like domain